ncbi:hypothetical protein LZ30DRAFT_361493 [Colletotrichum cereale]|nr:hypothetical protein LZ30DRAFT_361493 [Colletotrichum cereale]
MRLSTMRLPTFQSVPYLTVPSWSSLPSLPACLGRCYSHAPPNTLSSKPRKVQYKPLRPRCTSPTLTKRMVPWLAVPCLACLPRCTTRARTHAPRDDGKRKPIELIESVTIVRGGLLPNRTPAQCSMLCLFPLPAPLVLPVSCSKERFYGAVCLSLVLPCQPGSLAHGWVKPSWQDTLTRCPSTFTSHSLV